MNVLFIDTETTGRDPQRQGILQIAAEYHEDGNKVSSFNVKFCPSTEETHVDLYALKYNGFGFSAIESLGDERIAMGKFLDYILSLPKKDVFLCGHNESRFLRARM